FFFGFATRSVRAISERLLDAIVAERVRFELTEPLRARRFSRPLPSTARPPLRISAQSAGASPVYRNSNSLHRSLDSCNVRLRPSVETPSGCSDRNQTRLHGGECTVRGRGKRSSRAG